MKKVNKHPPEVYEKVVELWNKPMTGEAIAMQLGWSKSAVIGLIHRARLKGYPVKQHESLTTAGTYHQGELREIPRKPISVAVLKKPIKPRIALVQKAPEPEPEVRKNDVLIYELASNGCKYPTVTATNNAHKFCNAVAEGSYCKDHSSLVYQPRMGKVPYVRWGR